MDRELPYIDQHSVQIGATPDRVWCALMSVLHTEVGGIVTSTLTRGLRLEPAQSRGDWRGTLHPGDSLPGFEIAETHPPKRLVLRGRHRFSRYALVFELDAAGTACCALRAQSWAEFPGLSGRAYRALMIGTRGHHLVVRRLLRHVARRA